MSESAHHHASLISRELNLPNQSVQRTLSLLSEGNTIPFLARYRKEATGSLDEVQLRAIQERATYLSDLDARRATILDAIDEQGKLTPNLRRALENASTKTDLEDLYLPYKRKRHTRAGKARQRGLEPLAHAILNQPSAGNPARDAQPFVDASKDVADTDAALQGACDIVAEVVAEHPTVRNLVRESLHRYGTLSTSVVPAKKDDASPFRDYFDHAEPLRSVPSHRFLAIRRAEREGVIRIKTHTEPEPILQRILRIFKFNPRSPFARLLSDSAADSLKRLILPSASNDILSATKERAEHEAIDVFARNLHNLLLSPPAGPRPIIAIDPGQRTGCKCAVLDSTGDLLHTDTLYLVQGKSAQENAARALVSMTKRFSPFAIVVGNGTGGRDTETFARDTLRDNSIRDVVITSVNEAGASIYSASDIARAEFPDLDVSIRGAVSIGRRFQDPLAELVKIDPQSIGVGQYQHDVSQSALRDRLGTVVESCVNSVGVELNTASASLLSYVSGIGPKLASRIVEHRAAQGPFTSRAALKKVAGLGPKTFLQAAGFLRIRNGSNPLDASAVHPERYALVKTIAKDHKLPLKDLVGDAIRADRIDIRPYIQGDVGEPTLRDILNELKKPGRDPRAKFTPPKFREDIRALTDLQEGMILHGVITNVAAFGAFVDLGVKQDGLVHISQLADRYVQNPHDVARVGQNVRVKVLSIDLKRKRVGLSMKNLN